MRGTCRNVVDELSIFVRTGQFSSSNLLSSMFGFRPHIFTDESPSGPSSLRHQYPRGAVVAISSLLPLTSDYIIRIGRVPLSSCWTCSASIRPNEQFLITPLHPKPTPPPCAFPHLRALAEQKHCTAHSAFNAAKQHAHALSRPGHHILGISERTPEVSPSDLLQR